MDNTVNEVYHSVAMYKDSFCHSILKKNIFRKNWKRKAQESSGKKKYIQQLLSYHNSSICKQMCTENKGREKTDVSHQNSI